MGEFCRYYEQARPHQGLNQRLPSGGEPDPEPVGAPKVVRHDRVGGLLHDYRREAA